MKKIVITAMLVVLVSGNIFAEEQNKKMASAEKTYIQTIDMPLILPLGYFELTSGLGLGYIFEYKEFNNLLTSLLEETRKSSNLRYTFSDQWQWDEQNGFTWTSLSDAESRDAKGNLFFPIKKPVYSASFKLFDYYWGTFSMFPSNADNQTFILNGKAGFKVKYRYNQKIWSEFNLQNEVMTTINNILMWQNEGENFVSNHLSASFLTGFQVAQRLSLHVKLSQEYLFNQEIMNSYNIDTISHQYVGNITLGLDGSLSPITRLRINGFYEYILYSFSNNDYPHLFIGNDISNKLGFNIQLAFMWQKKDSKQIL
ncbi:MAG: hypothetical protein JXR63_05215 [Spirochaetales bacterium]|nr:hypothetical protein [Spirochaetales bacterium]